MKIVIDESVSYGIVSYLRNEGYSVIAIAEQHTSGFEDEEVFDIVIREQAAFFTRDHHFTNSLRFPPLIFIRKGNLTSDQENDLITNFLTKFDPQDYKGRLVTLYLGSAKIRS